MARFIPVDPPGEPTSETDPAMSPESGEKATASFSDLGLHPSLVAQLTSAGYEAPTPIQERAIPPLLAGRDVIGQPRPAPARRRRS